MPPPKLTIDDSVLADDLARIVAACERFETEWNAGSPERIEDDVANAPEPIRRRLFRELLALELELSRRDGRFPDLGTYLVRFPDRADVVRQLFPGPSETVSYPDVADHEMSGEERGTTSEGYEILRKLGHGGQATTYLARDRALNRLVALKRYHGVNSSARREAVLNEGRALARIRSPFVAPCYGVEARDGEIDLVVEFVPGRPLSELTADERADIGRCVRLIEEVAAGLAEVHACGLLHRDIKPQNIILGDDGVPRLVDFGLAVSVASDELHKVSGSPPYMAPEQARGQGERVDARTDVFGLGAVLYFLLTGKPPHEGKTHTEALEKARAARVVPPRRLNPRVPRALERICLRAMAAEPQARYSSSDALRQALGRYRLARRAAPVLAAVAIVLVTLASTWMLRSASVRPSAKNRGGATAGGASRPPASEPAPAPRGELRVTRFEIFHFPKLDEKTYDLKAAGLLGRKSFMGRVDDQVLVEAELSEPAYSYLVAFRPDGTDELCDPEDEEVPPSKKQTPQYPPPAKSEDRYNLSEGTGLYAFVLVASSEPLPSYRDWKKRVGPITWAAKLSSEPGVVWRDDGHGLEALVADDMAGTRGKGAKAREPSEPAAKLANWLRGLTGVDVVTLEAFPVGPASGP